MEYREAILECQETSYNTKKNPLMDYPGPFMKNQEALSNTTQLYEIPRSSMEYHGAVQKYQEVRWNMMRL